MFQKSLFIILLSCVFVSMAIAEPQPIVYYPFDKLGDVVTDESGNGNDGKPMGNVVLNDNGKFGKCYEFDGQKTYVELERVIQDDFTIMAWIKTSKDGLAGSQAYEGTGLIWSDVGGVANDFILGLLVKKLSFFVGNPDQSVTSDGEVVTGDWVHVAATRNTATGENAVYINGNMDKSIIHGNKGSLTALPTLAIGGNVLDNRFYTGLIDDVKIYNSVLSENEIKQVAVPMAVGIEQKLATTWGVLKVDCIHKTGH